MKGQIVKDFLLMKKDNFASIIIMIAAVVFTIAAGLFARGILDYIVEYSVYLTMFWSVFPILMLVQTILLDEKSGHLQYFFSMPVRRIDYIKGKYAFFFLNLFIFSVLGLAYMFLVMIGSTKGIRIDYIKENLATVMILDILQIYFSTIVISKSLKMNMENVSAKTTLSLIISFMLVMFISGFFWGYSEEAGKPVIFRNYLKVSMIILTLIWIYYLINGFRWARKKEF